MEVLLDSYGLALIRHYGGFDIAESLELFDVLMEAIPLQERAQVIFSRQSRQEKMCCTEPAGMETPLL